MPPENTLQSTKERWPVLSLVPQYNDTLQVFRDTLGYTGATRVHSARTGSWTDLAPKSNAAELFNHMHGFIRTTCAMAGKWLDVEALPSKARTALKAYATAKKQYQSAANEVLEYVAHNPSLMLKIEGTTRGKLRHGARGEVELWADADAWLDMLNAIQGRPDADGMRARLMQAELAQGKAFTDASEALDGVKRTPLHWQDADGEHTLLTARVDAKMLWYLSESAEAQTDFSRVAPSVGDDLTRLAGIQQQLWYYVRDNGLDAMMHNPKTFGPMLDAFEAKLRGLSSLYATQKALAEQPHDHAMMGKASEYFAKLWEQLQPLDLPTPAIAKRSTMGSGTCPFHHGSGHLASGGSYGR